MFCILFLILSLDFPENSSEGELLWLPTPNSISVKTSVFELNMLLDDQTVWYLKCNVSQLSCKSNKSVELGMSYSWKCPKYFKMVSSTSRRWDMIKIYFYIGPLKQRVLWSQCCLILSSKKWQILIFAENYFCRYLDKKGPKKVFFFYILSFHFSKTSLKVDLLWGLTTQSKIHVW